MFTVYNIVAYQVAWFACVLGAAYGMPWIGAAVAFAAVAAHLALTRPWAAELELNHSLRWKSQDDARTQ